MMKGEQIKPIRDSENKNSPARLLSRTKERAQEESRLLTNWIAVGVRWMIIFFDLNESRV